MQSAIVLVLQGAGGGKYSELLSTTTHRSENLSGSTLGNPNMMNQMYAPPQQNKSWFGKTKEIFAGK